MKGIQFRIEKISTQIQSILIKPSIKLTSDIFDINFSKFCIEGLQIAEQIIKQCCNQQYLLSLYEKLARKIKDARRFRPNIEDDNQDQEQSNNQISDFLNSRRPLKETKNLGELNYFLEKMEKKEKDTQMFLQNLGHIKRGCEIVKSIQFQNGEAQTDIVWVGHLKNIEGIIDQIKQSLQEFNQASKSLRNNENSNMQTKNQDIKEVQEKQKEDKLIIDIGIGQQEKIIKSTRKINDGEGKSGVPKMMKKSKQSIVINKKGNDKEIKQRKSRAEKPTSKVKISIQRNPDLSNFATETNQQNRNSEDFTQDETKIEKQKESKQGSSRQVEENSVNPFGDKKNNHSHNHNRLPSLCEDLNESRSTSKNHTERHEDLKMRVQNERQKEIAIKGSKTSQLDLCGVSRKMHRNIEQPDNKKVIRDKKGTKQNKQNQRSFSINESENIEQRQKERSTYKNSIKNQPFTQRVETKVPLLKLNTFNSQNNQDEGIQVLEPIQNRKIASQSPFSKTNPFFKQQLGSTNLGKELSPLEQKKRELISLHEETLLLSFGNQQGRGLNRNRVAGGKNSQESLPSIHKNKKMVVSQQQPNQQTLGDENLSHFHQLQSPDEDIFNNFQLKGSSESLAKKDAMIINKINELQKNSKPNQDQIKFYMQALQKLHRSICGKQCRHLERYYKQLKIGQSWHNRIAINLPTRKIGFFS